MTTLAWRSQEHFRTFMPSNAILVDHFAQQQEASTAEKRKRTSLNDTFGAGPSSVGASGSYDATTDTAHRDMSDGSTEPVEEEPMKKKKKAVTAKSVRCILTWLLRHD